MVLCPLVTRHGKLLVFTFEGQLLLLDGLLLAVDFQPFCLDGGLGVAVAVLQLGQILFQLPHPRLQRGRVLVGLFVAAGRFLLGCRRKAGGRQIDPKAKRADLQQVAVAQRRFAHAVAIVFGPGPALAIAACESRRGRAK